MHIPRDGPARRRRRPVALVVAVSNGSAAVIPLQHCAAREMKAGAAVLRGHQKRPSMAELTLLGQSGARDAQACCIGAALQGGKARPPAAAPDGTWAWPAGSTVRQVRSRRLAPRHYSPAGR